MTSPGQNNREKEIFEAALDCATGDERQQYLAVACGNDTALLSRIGVLLRAHEAGEDFLPEQPSKTIHIRTEMPGDQIGRYRLLQSIGEGGCGVVYMAEQTEPLRRRVALKVIKRGMDTRQVVARFEAERQALALMDHPNIAKVLDAGATEAGRPYFVMELVGGIRITDYCDQNQLTTRERLDLFIQVCRAVQHAHQKGIIHRDLKPSNVLVTLQDGVAMPKVIDFGIAKATQGPLADQTLFTAFEQFLGTPAYMSPEQAQMGGLDVDTRSDIYSLGVLLYELLTGKTPFDTKELLAAGVDAMRRTILEKEPPTPSTRMKQEAAARQARNSGESKIENARVPLLSRKSGGQKTEIDKDLDWIVMKCLEKERARRYETANGLAMDLQRHLNNEPVVASPPSRFYSFKKLARRNRATASASAAITIVLALGIIVSTSQAVRARRAERRARRAQTRESEERERAVSQKQVAEAILKFLQEDLLRQATTRAQADTLRQEGRAAKIEKDPTIRQLLDRAAEGLSPEKIEAKFPGQVAVQASILTTVGDTYSSIGEYRKAEELLSRASDLCRRAFGEQNADTLRTTYLLARTYEYAGKLPQAIALFERVRDVQIASLGNEAPDSLKTLSSLGAAYHEIGRLSEAIPLLQRVLKLQVKIHGPDHKLTCDTMYELASAYQGAGQMTQAAELYEQVRDSEVKTLGPEHPITLGTMTSLAQVYLYIRKVPQAVELLERVRNTRAQQLAPEDPSLLRTMNNLGEAYLEAGQLAQAIALFEEVRDAWVKRLEPDHPKALIALSNLGQAYIRAGRCSKAIELLERVRDAQIKQLGREHPEVLGTLNDLARAFEGAGRLNEAIPIFEQLSDATRKVQGADHPNSIAALHNLARAYRKAGKPALALPLLRQCAEAIEKRGFRDSHGDMFIGALINCLEQCHESEEALRWYRKWPSIVRQREGAESPKYAECLAEVGLILMKSQKWEEAESLLRQCLKLQEELLPDDWTTFNTRLLLGRALLAQCKDSEAEPLLISGHQGLKQRALKIPVEDRPRLKDTLRDLAELYAASGRSVQAAQWNERISAFAPPPKGQAQVTQPPAVSPP